MIYGHTNYAAKEESVKTGERLDNSKIKNGSYHEDLANKIADEFICNLTPSEAIAVVDTVIAKVKEYWHQRVEDANIRVKELIDQTAPLFK